ncbi:MULTISPECIES: PAS domain S-box protein [unclassified Imperialibacter]|uniref:PAS domain S-box protein n=1 Tax=unclassified Imperialibacter TaxID=2629706 RepID=UPI0012521BBC|nr:MULTISPECIES: PAS domain S-box protein [unclassified Imperialibacter]CAD5251408.1 putative Histidine kinase [Imperialibacter sp. 89]CAD5284553.1 putative Histidine kinase [Imperialibacter sp. 75]VVT11266.1 putative Histidine kinase [Imperialibacter sp. EC-SDR9]
MAEKLDDYLKKEAFQLIRSDEKLFELMQEEGSDGFWYWDTETQRIWANKKLGETFGLTDFGKQGAEIRLTDLFSEAEVNAVQECIRVALNEKKDAFKTNCAYTTPGGVRQRSDLYAHIIKNESGNPIRILGINIKKTSNPETALQKDYFPERLAAHLNNLPLGMVEYTPDLTISLWSKKCEEIFGWTMTEVLGNKLSAFNLIYAEDLERVGITAEELMTGKVDGNISLNRNYTKSGKIIHCVWYNSVTRDNKGEVISVMSLVQEVTKEKKIEETLRVNKERLKEAQRVARMGDFTWDLASNKFVFSKGLTTIIGYEETDEFFYDYINDNIHHPDDLPRVSQWLADCLASGAEKLTPKEYRLIRKDGEVIWIHAEGNIVYDRGKPASVFGTAQDITERRLAEEKLKASEKRFKSVVENGKDGLTILSGNGEVKYQSPSVVKMLGYSVEELTKLEQTALIHPADVHILTSAFSASLQHPRKVITVSPYRVRDKLGIWHWMEANMANYLDYPDIEGIVNNFSDVTERVESSKLLTKLNGQLKTAQKIANLGYFEWNWREGTVFWSEVLYSICGVTKIPSEQALADKIHPDDQAAFIDYRKQLNFSREPAKIEFRFLRNDEVRNLVGRTIPLLDENESIIGIEGTVQDITERKKYENEILRLSTFPSENPNPVLRVAKNKSLTYFNKASEPLFTARSGDEKRTLPVALWQLISQTFEAKKILRKELTIRDTTYSFTSTPGPADDYVNVYGLDISEQKKVEQALKESGHFLNEVGRIAKVGGWELHPETDVEIWTKELAEIHEVPVNEDGRYKFGVDFYTSKSRKIINKAVQDALEKGKPYDLELEIVTARGNHKWIRTIGQPIKSADGKIKLRGSFQDITQIKNAEEEILLEKNLSDQIINSLPGVFYLFTKQGKFLKWNKDCERISGYSAKEISEMNPLQFFSEEDRPIIIQRIFNVLNNGEDRMDSNFVLKDKTKIAYHITGKKIIYRGEECIMGVAIDITERNKAAEALKQSEEQYRSLFENMSEGFLHCESILNDADEVIDFAIIQSNPAFEAMTHLQNPVGKTASQLFPDLTVANSATLQAFVRVMGSGTPETIERFAEKLDKWFSISLYQHRKNHIVAMFQDITERKKASLGLLSSELKFRALVEQSLTGIYIFDKERFIYVNDQFASMFGYTVDEVLANLRPTDVVDEEDNDRAQDYIGQRFSGEVKYVHYSARGIKKDKTKIWIEIHGTHIELEGKPVITGTVLDITERVKTEESINKLLQKTTEQNIRLKDFSFITSHNIRSSVSNLLGLTDLLMIQPGSIEYIKMLRTSTLKLDATIKSINELIHFEDNLDKMPMSDCNILTAVNNVLALNNQTIRDKNIIVEKNISPELIFKCVPAYIDSILQNLLTNAIKYGTTEDQKTIKIESYQEASNIVISIQDFGTGIDLDRYQEKLFKLGARFHSSNEGQGLGLYMSKRQIEAMGGKINVESKPNVGSTFKVIFYVR